MEIQKRNIIDTVLFSVVVAAGLACIASLLFVAGPCTGMLELANGKTVPMRCFHASKMIITLALILIIIAGKGLVTKNYDRTACVLLALGMISATIESALGVGVCKAEMECWIMAFWIRTCAGLIIGAVCASGVARIKLKQVK